MIFVAMDSYIVESIVSNQPRRILDLSKDKTACGRGNIAFWDLILEGRWFK